MSWRGVVVGAGIAALLGSGCNDPGSPPAGTSPAGFQGDYDPSAGAIEFRLAAPNGAPTGLRLVATDLTHDPVSHRVGARVAIRNDGTVAVPGPDGVALSRFSPPDVVPLPQPEVVCQAPDACPYVYDHRGTYGDDALLSPGETSEPRDWLFLNPGDDSFSFHAAVVSRATTGPVIAGVVFHDVNGNGQRDRGEVGIQGTTVQLAHAGTDRAAITDGAGGYAFEITEPGLYEVFYDGSAGCRPTTPSRLEVVILQRPDGSLTSFDRAHFGCGGPLPFDSLVVSGVVFLDRNRNGRRDRDEPGVADVTVQAGSPCAAPCGGVSTTTTNAEGRYFFVDPAGCCALEFVSHDPVPGFEDTTPNPVVFGRPRPPGTPTPPPGPRPPGREFVVVNFGIAPRDPAQGVIIVGVVFDDANRNGVHDPMEAGLPNVLLVGSAAACPTFAPIEARTDRLGRYSLQLPDCIPPYIVHREALAGWIDTTPNPVVLPTAAGNFPVPGLLVANFGVARDAAGGEPSIEGVVFEDANRNGARDRGEPGVSNVEVAASGLLCLSPVSAVTRTDDRGHYRLLGADVHCMLPWVVQHGAVELCSTTPNPVIVRAPPSDGVFHIDFGVVACDSVPRPIRP